MIRISHAFSLGLVFLELAACGAAPAPPPSPAASIMAPRDRLSRIAERYWDAHASAGNPLSPQYLADSLAAERRHLEDVLAVPRAGLDVDSRLTYDILKRRLELDIEGFTYPAELLPLNPFDAMPLRLARIAADMSQPPLPAAKDYENWLRQIDDYAAWTEQAIANMRAGVRRGYTSPRPVMERMSALLRVLGEDVPANVFYLPLRDADRTGFASSLNGAVKDKLLPAMRKLHDFIQNEYLPRTRLSMSLSALPLGPSWYAYDVRRATATQLTPNELHAIGLAEVERIRARMAALAAIPTVGGLPAAPGPGAGAADHVNGYLLLKEQTLAALPTLFSAAPPADFEIRESTAPGATAALVYQPARPDGKPAILYVSAGPDGARPRGVDVAGFLEAALPGRHYQSALQQGRADLPKFRRFGSEPAFVEGWALYAATLGEELGLVRDDQARREALSVELNCAAGLVVDTGLHAKGWTREQAIDYLRAQLGASAADAGLMVDRSAALPGNALACKVGELKLRTLRTRAQTALGTRFDIHEFHSQLLREGAMPLDILESRMKAWMEARP
jgi:uncharacterized protein (DUF885 family)